MSGQILGNKDVNAPVAAEQKTLSGKPAKEVKSMEYHRQVFQSKTDEASGAYVSPSDDIMSPCSAKISALRNKHVAKAKPRSLFAQASAKRLQGDSTYTAANPF
ncbi:hypothetical protein N3K66_006904 [Trichothecium roseum]|uniref:Uncharacterized protein n=1 Tax=Trichothecium roseum TaxID=47278 RepID=A0ACC0UWU1_9HYPO|nr:hypothetical protein N3K66_006904 [Trichothecium roseum]